MRALQREIADVFDPARLAGGFVLAVDGSDGHDRFDREVVIKFYVGVFGSVLHAIECGGGGRGFAAARMAHHRNARHIDFAVEWIAFGLIPFLPEFQMLEEHPAANGLLFVRVVKQTAIQKIFIDGGEDDAAAGEQFAEVGISGIGKIRHVVIAMHDQSERKWAWTFGIPDARIQRELVDIEAPIFLARPALPSIEVLEEVGRVHGMSLDRDAGTIFRAADVVANAIEKFQYVERPGSGGIRCGQFRGHGIGGRLPGDEFFHRARVGKKPNEINIASESQYEKQARR